MMKYSLVTLLLTISLSANAEWYRVQSVRGYNTITASVADGENRPIVIRIRNLEKIEYIQSDPEKVLLGGREALDLSRAVLNGQLVWVENLQPEEGAYVADVYPSFEQVITAFRDTRIINGDNISSASRDVLKQIYRQMIIDLNLSPQTLQEDDEAMATATATRAKIQTIYSKILSDIRMSTPLITSGDTEPENSRGDYQRTQFIMESLIWFRDNGQLLHPSAQKLYIDLLSTFQNDSAQNARFIEIKIEDLQEQQELFKELFLRSNDFERGKFTYTALDWFKNRGQYLPQDVQAVFINWLRKYQHTNSSDGDFMQDRLQWMIDNNGLYQDFLDLDK